MTARRVTSADLALILGSVALGATGQVLMRAGMVSLGGLGAVDAVLAGLAQPLVLLGITSYAVSSLLWLVALSRVPLSTAYPFGALSYVIVVLVALATGETVPALRWLGVVLIVGGIWFVGGAKEPATVAPADTVREVAE
jgi:drug/metabolite transporter (DMT)-like permease